MPVARAVLPLSAATHVAEGRAEATTRQLERTPMSLHSLHDRVRRMGLGAMYERHERSAFRDLFDDRSPDWAATAVTQKVIDLKAFASAGVSAGEIIGHYCQTMTQEGRPQVLDS